MSNVKKDLAEFYRGDVQPKGAVINVPVPAALLKQAINRLDALEQAMQKFVDKVDSGRAVSTETYSHFKRLLPDE